MAKSYHCKIEVRGYELDSFGHVNHAEYVSYLEHARWKLLEEEGITLEKMRDWKRWPVIAEIDVKYLKPTFMGDVLSVNTRIVGHTRVSFDIEQQILKNEVPVVNARIKAVIINEQGRPSEPPPEVVRVWTAGDGGKSP